MNENTEQIKHVSKQEAIDEWHAIVLGGQETREFCYSMAAIYVALDRLED